MPHLSTPVPAVTHYENFPVASWLCPARLRAPIAAIYHFARTADDLADEGDFSAAERLHALAQYRAALVHAQAPAGGDFGRWSPVFIPLRWAIAQYHLPVQALHDLLDAFVQDVEKTRDHATYANQAALLDYCRRSANPVGRLLLHLYGVHSAQALARSDAICTALQLINFWQDLSVDIPRGRYYLSTEDCLRFGVCMDDVRAQRQTPALTQLIRACVQHARATMQQGAPLVHQIPGRAGWELRLVVQGGLCILDKIEALQFTSVRTRPRVRWWDAPRMLWRALWM